MEDRLLETAIDRAAQAVEENARRLVVLDERLRSLGAGVKAGRSATDLMRESDGASVVQLMTENLAELQASGVELRYALARVLVSEGHTAADVARLFGVTRQRVSALLHDPRRAGELGHRPS